MSVNDEWWIPSVLQFDLYPTVESTDESLTDEQKLNRFKLGQVHFSLQVNTIKYITYLLKIIWNKYVY